MICKVCGRKIANENANFCEYCGASFRFGTDNKVEQVIPPVINTETQGQASNQGNMKASGASTEQPITFKNWLGILILPFIPFIGMPAFIIILITWAFGKGVPATRKNFARAMLIVSGIMLLNVIYAIMLIYSGSLDSLLNLSGSLICFMK